ncbi:hypothetical protein LIER_11962 [Lithospermum erythrorhizon]|uniref:Transposase MuDR plant domain-containing protein n=1 Tax=Lithospermum erythrorhizon TaxID=34254 RepID=A0AAV3PRU6_LITER
MVKSLQRNHSQRRQNSIKQDSVQAENEYTPFIQFDTQENLDDEERILESEFNNDDEEHILEDENEVGAEHDSDAPSSVLGDMERKIDEDVQSSINDTMTRRERYNYRRKKLKQKHTPLRKKIKYDVENDVLGANGGIDGWFSDIEDEDDTCLNNPPDYHVAEPIFNPNADLRTYDLAKEMKFTDWKHCKDVIIGYFVLRGFKVVWKHKERKRLTTTCEGNCGWRIQASPILNTNTFQIKQYSDGGHTCNPDKENPLAHYKFIGRKMTSEVKENPNMKISEFIKKVDSLFGQEISYHKALRAKEVALNILHGSWDEQYTMLRNYCATVKEYNRFKSIAITVNRCDEM